MPAGTDTGTGLPPLHGLLLAGGRSRRLGRDKALLEVEGETLLRRGFALLTDICHETFVAIGPAQQQDLTRQAFPTLVDTKDDAGPLCAIASAARHHPQAAWLVLAVDMPMIDQTDLARLRAERSQMFDVVCFDAGNQPEPLAAIWEPAATALASLRFDEGARSPIRLLRGLRTRYLKMPAGKLASVNHPEDLNRL